MALADYYNKAAVAASQVIAGFSADLFRRVLEKETVGLAIDRNAASSDEGKSLADLSIRLLARLYPRIELRAENSAQGELLEKIARSINPRIEFVSDASIGIGIGPKTSTFETTYFAGSNGWDALLSTNTPKRTGASPNPLGAGAAACLAVAAVFNRLLLPDLVRKEQPDTIFSTFSRERVRTSGAPAFEWRLAEDAVLVGAGAIGNGAAWALGRAPFIGNVHVVDHETVELSNLQRYVLAERDDDGRPKVEVIQGHLLGQLCCIPHQVTWADFVARCGYEWRRVLVALDSAADRRSVQATLPEWVANAWTQPGDLGVSVHDRFDGPGACLYCLYLPAGKTPNEDELMAAALGVPELAADIRTLLHTGSPVTRRLLEAVAQNLGRKPDDVLVYEGRTVRELYVEGICGGGLIPLGSNGAVRQELHVPLAHQSALAGVLLTAALLRRAAAGVPSTFITRINVMEPVGDFLTQPALKARTGSCICDDEDYVRVYQEKFGSPTADVPDKPRPIPSGSKVGNRGASQSGIRKKPSK